MGARLVCLPLAFAIFAGAQDNRKTPESLLTYRITGSSNSSSPRENATYAMRHIEVQRLLLAVAASPRSRDYVETALHGSGISLDDMLHNGSLRMEGGQYWLNFTLLTRDDQEVLVRAARVHAQRLADSVLARRSRIDALLRSYSLAGLDPKAAAFIVLGCFSLDWDGLNFATERGYRATPPKRASGRFFFMAEERGGPSLKRVYWGSSNSSYGNYRFTSFGDHFTERGELWSIRRDGPPELQAVPAQEFAETAGAVMLALREGPLAAPQLPLRNLDSLLAGLVSGGYVRKDGERYSAAIPVFALRDQAMISGLLQAGREAMEEWFTANYEDLRTSLRDISALRNRVSFPVVFDQLWHYVFGMANQKLVEAGLFADPYAPNANMQGYIPAVYARGLQLRHVQKK